MLLALLVGCAAGVSGPARADVRTGDGAPIVLVSAEYLDAYHDLGPPPDGVSGIELKLPLKFPESGGDGHTGTDDTGRWVRLRFDFPRHGEGAYDAYFAYLAPKSSVYLNGVYLGSAFGLSSHRHSCGSAPQLFSLPALLLRPANNEILIHFSGFNGGTDDLDRVMVGTEEAIRPSYERQLWIQVLGIEVVSILAALVGLLAAVLWWRHRSDAIFGVFALSCAFWILRNCQFFVDDPPIPADWFLAVTDAALFWLTPLLFVLCFRFLGRRFRRIEAVLFCYSVIATTIALVSKLDGWLMAVDALQGVCSVLFVVYLSIEAWRSRTVLVWLIWAAALVATLAGAYDYSLNQKWINGVDVNLMPYSSMMFSLTIGWALIDRFVRTHRQLEELNVELEGRIRAREEQLAAHYSRLNELERAHAVAHERDRILRDMHDGLGLQLISSMQMAQRGSLSHEQTVELFDEALNELRIAIDSVMPTAGDLLVMLGNLRYRVEPRLQNCGIELEWDVQDAPRLASLSSGQIMEITRIIQEAFTNAMKHSGASCLHVRVASAGTGTEGAQIAVIDNGRGFCPGESHRGVGLASMHHRARKIGGALEIVSQPGKTALTLTF